MATEYLFSNNATTTLAQSISATATVLNVASGDGSMFPNPGQGQAFAVTLVDAATGLTNEICYCTSRSGDKLTVMRGQEGTNAVSWQAGDTCANYITADVMESWLQESDLNGYVTETEGDARYLMLSSSATQTVTGQVQFDNLVTIAENMHFRHPGLPGWDMGVNSNGTLFISSLGSNGNWIEDYALFNPGVGIEFVPNVAFSGATTVPDITDFTDANALNARTAEGRYVGKATGSQDFPALQAGVNKTTGNPWLSYNDGSGFKFAIAQQAGDYATNTALNTEITNRTNADTNLDNAKVNRAGDTMSGGLTISAPKTTTTNGQYNYAPGIVSMNQGGAEADFFAQEQVGNSTAIALRLRYNGADKGYWWFNEDGNITQSTKGDVLFASDAAALYATFAYAQGTVGSSGNDWFWMKLPNGWIIQGGNAAYYAADGIAGTTIKLPTSFGAQFVIAVGNDVGSNANAVTVMRVDASTIRLLGREVTGGTLSNTTINYLCVGTAP